MILAVKRTDCLDRFFGLIFWIDLLDWFFESIFKILKRRKLAHLRCLMQCLIRFLDFLIIFNILKRRKPAHLRRLMQCLNSFFDFLLIFWFLKGESRPIFDAWCSVWLIFMISWIDLLDRFFDWFFGSIFWVDFFYVMILAVESHDSRSKNDDIIFPIVDRGNQLKNMILWNFIIFQGDPRITPGNPQETNPSKTTIESKDK